MQAVLASSWEVAVKGEEQSSESEEGREENGREAAHGQSSGRSKSDETDQASGVGPLRLAAEAMTGLAGKALERSAAAAEKAP